MYSTFDTFVYRDSSVLIRHKKTAASKSPQMALLAGAVKLDAFTKVKESLRTIVVIAFITLVFVYMCTNAYST